MSQEVHPATAAEDEEAEVLLAAGVELTLEALQPSSEQRAPVELLAEVAMRILSITHYHVALLTVPEMCNVRGVRCS